MERLDRSHRRLEERLEELSRSALAIAEQPASRAHWATVTEVLAFLEDNGQRHEEDEEQTVFPRLADQLSLRPLLKRLRTEHRSQRKLVAALAKIVDARNEAGAARKLGKISNELRESYLAHIECEDQQLLPAMRRHIDSSQQADMAAEMANRRS